MWMVRVCAGGEGLEDFFKIFLRYDFILFSKYMHTFTQSNMRLKRRTF